jgi:DNA-binding transcriptional LysR family regulator
LRHEHEEIEQALLASKLDFGFTDRRSARRDLVQVRVVDTDLRFFVGSKLARRSLRDLLANLPLTLCRTERRANSAVEEVLESLGLTPRAMIISEFPSLVEGLCREGVAVAVVGRLHFEADPQVTMLRLPREFPNLSERLYAMWPVSGENSQAVRRLRQVLPRASS